MTDRKTKTGDSLNFAALQPVRRPQDMLAEIERDSLPFCVLITLGKNLTSALIYVAPFQILFLFPLSLADELGCMSALSLVTHRKLMNLNRTPRFSLKALYAFAHDIQIYVEKKPSALIVTQK